MEQMEILCLGSGSSGNCYAFRKNNQVVLVECGLEYDTICSKLISNGISPNEIVASIVTHKHKDHSLALPQLRARAIPVYNNFIKDDPFLIGDKDKKQITDWLTVYCFSVNHDVPALGFAFLDTETTQSYLFINDTFDFEFPLRSIRFDVVMIECNFIQTQLEAIKKSNPKGIFKYSRQERSHLSLLGTKNMLSQMDLYSTKLIVLMHLSMDCANETLMKCEIESVYGIRTLIAKANGGMN